MSKRDPEWEAIYEGRMPRPEAPPAADTTALAALVAKWRKRADSSNNNLEWGSDYPLYAAADELEAVLSAPEAAAEAVERVITDEEVDPDVRAYLESQGLREKCTCISDPKNCPLHEYMGN